MCLSISGLHSFSPVRVIMHFGHAGGESKKEDLYNSYVTQTIVHAQLLTPFRFIITGYIISGVLFVFYHVQKLVSCFLVLF